MHSADPRESIVISESQSGAGEGGGSDAGHKVSIFGASGYPAQPRPLRDPPRLWPTPPFWWPSPAGTRADSANWPRRSSTLAKSLLDLLLGYLGV